MTEEKFHLTYETTFALWDYSVGSDIGSLPGELEKMNVDEVCVLTAILESKDPNRKNISRKMGEVNHVLGDRKDDYELTITQGGGWYKLKARRIK